MRLEIRNYGKNSIVAFIKTCDCGAPDCTEGFAVSTLRKSVADNCPGVLQLWQSAMEGIALAVIESEAPGITADFAAKPHLLN
jgi:hypothetical protein